ncbi:YqeG family HAD IIIA-type phosphatase [Atopobium fossor]|uniref:YqeG family HAD IIIA-type phosphatase n=1 Tax=Atopobium fossor TaxID=39487 RepID=UPI0003F8F396|nr:YqeG family HAD IIIA-type phosphatase [Atopobium fossor]
MGFLQATKYVASLPQVNIDELVCADVHCVLLDRDNTCVPQGTKQVPPEVKSWVERAKHAGLRICLISNNFFSTDVAQTADEFGVLKIDHAMKPAPFALWRALRRMGVSRDKAVLIGDQVFTDVLAGNLAGVSTILVRPQSVTDLFYTKLFRIAEHRVLNNVTFEGDELQQ